MPVCVSVHVCVRVCVCVCVCVCVRGSKCGCCQELHKELSTLTQELTVPIPSKELVTMPKKMGISFQSIHRKLLLSEKPEGIYIFTYQFYHTDIYTHKIYNNTHYN